MNNSITTHSIDAALWAKQVKLSQRLIEMEKVMDEVESREDFKVVLRQYQATKRELNDTTEARVEWQSL